MDDHWLVRPATIRRLWIAFIAILAATVLAGLFVDLHPHFAVEALFAFNAWYGFAACAALIFGAKAIGLVLKRRDDYYDERGGRRND
jgi:hypothetical protein